MAVRSPAANASAREGRTEGRGFTPASAAHAEGRGFSPADGALSIFVFESVGPPFTAGLKAPPFPSLFACRYGAMRNSGRNPSALYFIQKAAPNSTPPAKCRAVAPVSSPAASDRRDRPHTKKYAANTNNVRNVSGCAALTYPARQCQ